MKLSPNVGSDRSWVWNTAADVSEDKPEAQTLAIRFANTESTYQSYGQCLTSSCMLILILLLDADKFKDAFIKAQQDNEALFSMAPTEGDEEKSEKEKSSA